ncbi:transglutaminase [Pleurocapsales cyanobacterium LEGE 10410]|nr:transglutaminase [Pleurocapsales cyanobacterium LEGE 10410]
MTARRSLKPRQGKIQKANKSGNLLAGTVLGILLLLTTGNIKTAFHSFNEQQLISIPSDSFDSSKYLPIHPGSTKKIAQQDLAQIDRLAKKLNYSGESVTELASILEQNAVTELEKARIIYAWVTQHISYDVPAFLDAVNNDNYPDVSPQKVLRDRSTICSGYSNLYYALAEAMNLESAIVVGYAKGATPEEEKFLDVNHAWNAVKIDDAWYLLDATWGAGSVREEQFVPEYKPYYFATAPDEFINNHYPKDRGWQLLAQTYTRAEFNNLPKISSRFYNLGLKLVSHNNYRISAPNRIDLKLQIPQDVVALANLEQNNRESNNAILVNRQNDHLIVSVAPPEAGTYDLTIYAKKQDDPGKYGEVINYQIEATQSVASLPQVYAHFNQYQASLIEPLTADLKPNWSTYFNLIVPEAEDVQVLNTATKQWIPLNGYGSYFAGHVEIQPGNTIVVAKFPGDERYWQLVEYQAR